jgi:hypothetical protein
MKISIENNFPQVASALEKAARQVPFSMAVALNKTTEKAKTNVQKEMESSFHSPTRFFLNSLRVIRATKQKLETRLWFKDGYGGPSDRFPTASAHIDGGNRELKPMEWRLIRASILPAGWRTVPGEGAEIDANGNMNRGQITQMLNVLQTYREDGYNKANDKTIKRLKRGSVKKNIYGFQYVINPVFGAAGPNLMIGGAFINNKKILPGIYKRVKTPFGSSLKPILIFVKATRYKKRLKFYETVDKTINQEFGKEFDDAFNLALKTAIDRK